jgi:signal transduction histidine kinase
MRLRQKLFAAILAAMVLMFLLLSLASFLNALEAQTARRELEGRLEAVATEEFLAAVGGDGKDRWSQLSWRLEPVGADDWEVTLDGLPLLDPEREDLDAMLVVLNHGPYELLRARNIYGLEPVRWLSTLFWALASGTVVLLLVVYGLLSRLILRPVEDLVAASRALSSGGRPPRVAGDSRPDEIGELIKVFNKMVAEVVMSREDLKHRVEEATAERERALKRLALEQRLSATGKLAAGVAHEINNPLGGMMNAARTLSSEPGMSPRAVEYVELIEDGLRRIANIVERMRSFVRAKAAVGTFSVQDAVRGAVSFARHRIESQQIELAEEYGAADAFVAGDIGELQQVFLNVILNALDAMADAASKRLSISVKRVDALVSVEFVDTGSGMNEEQLASAFDLFYSTKEAGTGLGLAISHTIVVDHGGEMELDSVEGRGTTARIRLPCVEDRAESGPGQP